MKKPWRPPTPPAPYRYWREAWQATFQSEGVRVTLDLRTLPVVLEDLETQIRLDHLSNKATRKNFADDLKHLLSRKWLRPRYARQVSTVLEQLNGDWRSLLQLVRVTRNDVEKSFPTHCAGVLSEIVGNGTLTEGNRNDILELSDSGFANF